MAHPYKKYAEAKVGKQRAQECAKHYASGGAVQAKASGGRITGGAETGVGRLEKAKAAKSKQ